MENQEKVLSPTQGATPACGAGAGADTQPHEELRAVFEKFAEKYVCWLNEDRDINKLHDLEDQLVNELEKVFGKFDMEAFTNCLPDSPFLPDVDFIVIVKGRKYRVTLYLVYNNTFRYALNDISVEMIE
jgi:hypothetical protein